jgi:choline kinase
MSDHLWTVGLAERLIAFDAPEEDAVLAVDTNIAGCFDLPDATKVQSRDSRIVRIGKELPEFDCLDTGVFRISLALIDALEEAETENGCSLSEGVMKLACHERMWVCDVTGESWIDVDTPEALAFCEENLESFD